MLLSDLRVRLLLAVVLSTTAAQLCADFLPRGPITRVEALVAIPAAAAVGLAAGALVRRRFAVLLAPMVFVVVVELGQMNLVGPTVDRPRLTLMGVLAWVAVRLALGALLVAPMAVGAGWGVQLAARRTSSVHRFRRTGTAVLALTSLGIVALAVLVAVPASTAPILGPDGQPRPNSIAELITIDVNGLDQSLLIRGVDADAPVLLHLAGGPGGTDLGAMRLDTSLEEHFVVVTWDQRGTGKSYRAIDPTSTLTIDGAVADTLVVTDYLRERFDEDRIVITGQSYGTVPAVLAAARHPERYRAVVSTGQMVDVTATDRLFHDDVTAEARRRGDEAALGRLAALGPPPYERWEEDLVLNDLERGLFTYPEFDGHTEMTSTIWGPENSLMDRLAAIRGLLDTYALLYPRLQQVDLRESVPRLDVPLYVVMGEHESRGRVVPARAWFDRLDAPAKEWVELPASGHRASFEQPARYTRLLVRVLTETDGA
ncbi:alpha/beta fold hydrolase [Egicoccus sp. AB-alg2]|uniref:alpha/beta fold hydrolase n=1 Tax=Egicoccus sp. AB-alg2 TaxID=3242693 RepID=UPI00359CD5A1